MSMACVSLFVTKTQVKNVAVVYSIRKMEKLGEDLHKEFLANRLMDSSVTVNETILKSNFVTSVDILRKENHMHNKCGLSLKDDLNLFSTLYIACQVDLLDADVLLPAT